MIEFLKQDEKTGWILIDQTGSIVAFTYGNGADYRAAEIAEQFNLVNFLKDHLQESRGKEVSLGLENSDLERRLKEVQQTLRKLCELSTYEPPENVACESIIFSMEVSKQMLLEAPEPKRVIDFVFEKMKRQFYEAALLNKS